MRALKLILITLLLILFLGCSNQPKDSTNVEKTVATAVAKAIATAIAPTPTPVLVIHSSRPTATPRPVYVRPTATPRPIYVRPTATSSISPESAINYIGRRGTVCGKVVDSNYAVRSNGSPTFLNFSRAYPNHPFVIVIWGQHRSNFPSYPETYYLLKNVCVTGLIESYKGKPDIAVSNRSQIVVVN